MKTKRPCDKAVRTTISLPPELWRIAEAEQRRRAFSTFSGLIQDMFRQRADLSGATDSGLSTGS